MRTGDAEERPRIPDVKYSTTVDIQSATSSADS